jgi:hypothetical protein
VYSRYSRDPALIAAQEQAQTLHLGLWSRAPAIEPEIRRRDCWRVGPQPGYCDGRTEAAVARSAPSGKAAVATLWQRAHDYLMQVP